MSTNRTFTMIKPDAVSDGFSGPIIQQIEEAGFKIIALKKIRLSPEEAGNFYEVHKERPFSKACAITCLQVTLFPWFWKKKML